MPEDDFQGTSVPEEASESSEPIRCYRNHWSIIIQNLLTAVILLGLILLLNNDSWEAIPIWAAVIAMVAVLVVVYSVIIWKRTVYTFDEDGLHVSRDTLIKMDKHIRYDRLAMVGVRRSILNRVLGTSTLTFNVNSSVDANSAEASLILPKEIADHLRDELNAMIFHKNVSVKEEVTEFESMVHISNMDIILHSFMAQSTAQALYGIIMLIYAVICLFGDNQGGLIVAVILLVVGEVYPIVRQILKYFNYRIIRIGDTISVESGLFSTYRSSFKINKINSVRIRQPLIARLFGKAVLEAEVVGLASGDDDSSPLLCPLKGKEDVMELFRMLVPEFGFEPEVEHQPRSALMPMIVTDLVASLVMVAFLGAVIYYVESNLYELGGFMRSLAMLAEVAAVVLVPVVLFGHSGLAQRNRAFAMGPESFLFVYGAYDISIEYINYDKVQHVGIYAGPIQRRCGVARCQVYLMSAMGAKEITSGLFPPEDLEAVSEEIMARIGDGRYDYRRYY